VHLERLVDGVAALLEGGGRVGPPRLGVHHVALRVLVAQQLL